MDLHHGAQHEAAHYARRKTVRNSKRPRKRYSGTDYNSRHVELTNRERAWIYDDLYGVTEKQDARRLARLRHDTAFFDGMKEVMRGPIRDNSFNGVPHWADVAGDRRVQAVEKMRSRIQAAAGRYHRDNV